MIYRWLGRTGFQTSALGLGGESALDKRSDKAVAIIERAITLGVNYFDTAPLYEESELNYGQVLPRRRDKMFIATKTDQRDYDSAWRQFENSLKRLRVDRVDLLQIHHLDSDEEIKAIFDKNGVVKMVNEAKDQGLTGFIGVTGHRDPDVLLSAITKGDFDTILLAVNPADIHVHSFMGLIGEAMKREMGIMAMKVLARGKFTELLGWRATDPIHYVLSLGVSNAVIGVMNEAQLVKNAQTVSDWQMMPEDRMQALETATKAQAQDLNFYRKGNENMPFPRPPNMVTEAL
jgi:aryl-alcohol dehydrogenase-like predicted oxidoreductase